VTKRHAKNNTGKKGKSATSGAKRRIQRDRLAKKRCKRFNLREITDPDFSYLTASVQNEGYCLKLYHDRFFLCVSVQSSDDIHYSGFRQHNLRIDVFLIFLLLPLRSIGHP
jgi:hypothetical protein